MTKLPSDIVAELMADIGSPTILADIDRAINILDHQREELITLRKMALRRQTPLASPVVASVPSQFYGGNTIADEKLCSLIARYKADPDSPFHKLRFKTREHYEMLLKRLDKDIGQEWVGSFDLPKLRNVHATWSTGGKFSMAHGLVTMLRIVAAYGATDPNNRAVRELKMNIQDLNIPSHASQESQVEGLTPEQADLVIAKANAMGFHSVALAQAFQSDLKLRQKDVIGDWVPLGERIESTLIDGELKWVSGLRWEEIGKDLTLRHPPSNGGKIIEVSLFGAPRVRQEISRFGSLNSLPKSGAVIVRDKTGIPWVAGEFRRIWRKVANEAGIPKSVKNGG